jgi:hypothetical protein
MFDGGFDYREGLAAVLLGEKAGSIRRDGSFAIPTAIGFEFP